MRHVMKAEHYPLNLIERYIILGKELDTLKRTYNKLENDCDTMNRAYRAVQADYSTLLMRYNSRMHNSYQPYMTRISYHPNDEWYTHH